ncbi:MAG: cbb3-type cytochrome c oxidase subunit 3 [Kofleriaceae bacterium]|nr:cbb3-type cytochrome c oxidase subunit 3 [Myxococcales bacterium]MCB9565344.1 cbb3-type cytochrome c oxidase subunit 3 [Kofleriaceae bacterium]
MRLSELVATLTPATFTIVALVMFVLVFVGVAVRTLRPAARAELDAAGSMPLDDDGPGDREQRS